MLHRDAARAGRAAELLKAVAHPLRLRLVALLCVRAHNVSELSAILEAPQSTVSQQLAILRRERLVAAARIGGMAVYRVAEPHLRELIGCVERCTLG